MNLTRKHYMLALGGVGIVGTGIAGVYLYRHGGSLMKRFLKRLKPSTGNETD